MKGRVVLVTGAARGIGAACAEEFRRVGAMVIAADIADGDLTVHSDVERLFGRIREEYGGLDVLVANAGVPSANTTLNTNDHEWQACIDVNLRSVWWCARAAYRMLRAGGSIVTIASAQGLRSGKQSFPYSAAKGGVLALTRSLAVEYAPSIRVNAIIPGQIESVRTAAFFEKYRDPEVAERRVRQTFPLQRLGKPEEIAKAVRFLASDDASYITGTFLYVDGGRDAAMPDLSDLELR